MNEIVGTNEKVKSLGLAPAISVLGRRRFKHAVIENLLESQATFEALTLHISQSTST
ncbi:MAG: hypothetical protein RDV41_01920 [Planctomycetota bacterium]|nr:hypothetical protein [Planctomycetota bacterium]